MSIVVKGAKMPNNCGTCPLRLAWCRQRLYMITRPERCPLEPVRKGTWVSHWEHCEREKVLASGLTSYFWCSVCNMPSPEVTNFCPNCGAFMSEGETDD